MTSPPPRFIEAWLEAKPPHIVGVHRAVDAILDGIADCLPEPQRTEYLISLLWEGDLE